MVDKFKNQNKIVFNSSDFQSIQIEKAETKLITLVLDIKFSAYQYRKCCLDRFEFSDISSLICHSCTDIVFKNWTYVQFEKVDEKAWILKIKNLYGKVDKLDRFSKDFENIYSRSTRYSFKMKSFIVVLVAEVCSWLTGESYNFKLGLLDSKLPTRRTVFYNVQ